MLEQGVILGRDPRPDTVVTFTDRTGTEYQVLLPRSGHTDSEVRAVAYRWACKQVAEGNYKPVGELRFARIGHAH